MSARIRIGTASWTDPGFVQDWYPAKLPKNQLLTWYAQHFDFVEVNSSFYSIPNARVVEGWCRQTPDDFVFDVKLFKLLSRHSTEAKFLPPDLRAKAGAGPKAELSPELETLVAERFLSEVQPLRRAGKLGAFLLQLSPSFRPKTSDLSELNPLIELFSQEKLAIELRNRDWMDEKRKEDTIQFFSKKHVCLVGVDAPESEHFTVIPFSDVVTNPDLAYWRFHGRDEEAFVKGRTVAERFDYDYSKEEIEQIAEKVEAVAPKAKELHLVFNNNRSNYAPKAAAQLLDIIQKNRQLGGERTRMRRTVPTQGVLFPASAPKSK
jgi:uncharacterized protein YecE (DUF72 family)